MRQAARSDAATALIPPRIVAFPAEVDITNAERLRGKLRAAFRPGVAVVVADLSRTGFCDSSGIRCLIVASDLAAARRAELRVAITSAAVDRVIRVLGADQVLNIYSSLQAALADRHPDTRDAGPGG